MTRQEREHLVRIVRALSSMRANKHGPPPASLEEWWDQIQQLAAEHAMPITWEQWQSAREPQREPLLV